MSKNLKRAAASLTILSFLAAFLWIAFGHLGWNRVFNRDGGIAFDLVNELRAESPLYYQWLDAGIGARRYPIPRWLANKVIQADLDIHQRRQKAAAELAGMGTNARPAFRALLKLADHRNASIGINAGLVLARLNAQEHPGWPALEKRLNGRKRAARIFRQLALGRNEFGQPTEFAHRQFGFAGLAAVGPAAAESIPAVAELLKSREDHEVWGAAMAALHRIGGDMVEAARFHKEVLRDAEGSPNVRASAVQALAVAAGRGLESPDILRQALQDEKSHVRLAAARELWKLNALPDEVLPALKDLLGHKLTAIRLGALNAASRMGSAARPIESEIARLASDKNESVKQAAAAALKAVTEDSNPEPP